MGEKMVELSIMEYFENCGHELRNNALFVVDSSYHF
jgi:hypothetical protein